MFRAGPSTLRVVRLPMRRGLATVVAAEAQAQPAAALKTRHDWTKPEIKAIYDSPLLELVFRAASVHRAHHDPRKIQLCTLMNIKSACCCPRPLRRRLTWTLAPLAPLPPLRPRISWRLHRGL